MTSAAVAGHGFEVAKLTRSKAACQILSAQPTGHHVRSQHLFQRGKVFGDQQRLDRSVRYDGKGIIRSGRKR